MARARQRVLRCCVEGDVEIGALMTTINEPAQRVAMHAVRVELLEAQAAALGLPLWKIPIPSPCPNEAYERAMAGAVARAVAEGFTHVAFGDLFLEDVRRYREERLAGNGADAALSALWRRHRRARARDDRGRPARADHLPEPGRARSPVRRPRLRRGAPGRPAAGRRSRAASAANSTPARTAARCSAAPIPIETGVTVERDGFVFADLTDRNMQYDQIPDDQMTKYPESSV